MEEEVKVDKINIEDFRLTPERLRQLDDAKKVLSEVTIIRNLINKLELVHPNAADRILNYAISWNNDRLDGRAVRVN
jgi:hypothetical protein